MKTALLILALLLPWDSVSVGAEYYQWTDRDGVTHFTDNPDKIPNRYRKRARKLELSDTAPAQGAGEPAPARPPAPAANPAPKAAPELPGGQPESWWRERFAGLRAELKTLQDELPAKEAKLAEARRKRLIYTRVQDRVAVNTSRDALTQDQVRIDQLKKELADLEVQATKAGVPPEWRQ